jgi:hypothetical protein
MEVMVADKKEIAKEERITEIVACAVANGDDKACELFQVSPATLIRYKRYYKNNIGEQFELTALLKRIAEQYSKPELQAIAKGGRIIPGYEKVPSIQFEGDCVTLGYLTDPHIGSIFFKEKFLLAAFGEFEKENVNAVLVGGDVTEGMSNRPGHIYELTHLGYDRQRDYAVELFSECHRPMYFIDGNHDRWFIKKADAGAIIVKDVCSRLEAATFLGHDEGDIPLRGGVVVKLWHGEDGNSYALSYRLQKIIESFTGGEKPHVLFCGHTHKYVKIFERHVWAVSGGAITTQSRWMRSKRQANHTGFVIAKVWIDSQGVAKFQDTFYPFYT